jgi:CrcB protein
MEIILIAFFGSLGVLSRYGIDKVVMNSNDFPLATFTSNMMGCFLIGLLAAYFESKGHNVLTKSLMIGFCGGLTTFSSYALQGLNGFTSGNLVANVGYLILSPLLGIALVFIAKAIFKTIY